MEQYPKNPKVQGGARSIRRTIAILREISRRNEFGIRLSKIARNLDLPPPTVHRILSVLLEEGFLFFDSITKRYHLGSELYTLGSATRQFSIRDRYRTAVKRICDQLHDSTYLVIRSGYDGVCIDRAIGSFRVQVFGYDIGERRPLGVGAAGQALLSFLSEKEREEIINANAPRYKRYFNIEAEEVRSWVRKNQEMKYTCSIQKVTSDSIGVGVPIFNKKGQVAAAVSTAGITARMTPDRREDVAKIILAEIEAIEPPD